MPTLHTVIRRPVITEKGLGVKEAENTLVFEVAPNATKTEVKAGRGSALQGEGGRGTHGNICRQGAPAGQVRGLQAGLEESVREAEGRREAAGVREQSVRQLAFSFSFSLSSSKREYRKLRRFRKQK